MKRIIRLLAVIALALSPVWGYREDVAASGLSSPARYPVWPSFLSTGCFAIQGPSGSTTVSCGTGAFLLTQVNSGYECNQLDINVPSFGSGPFTVTATVNSGSVSNTLSINGTGNYFLQFPGFLVNNLITIQIASPDSGSMTVGSISTSACPVPTDTPTVNPSFTPTNTPVAVTGTPTAIPTHTPLPSGHSTFTPTVTATGSPVPTGTTTPTVSPTPGLSEFNCGDVTYPLLNCNLLGGTARPIPPDHWVQGPLTGDVAPFCSGADQAFGSYTFDGGYSEGNFICEQDVTPSATGELWVQWKGNVTSDSSGSSSWGLQGTASGVITVFSSDSSACPAAGSTWCYTPLGVVTASLTSHFAVTELGAGEHTATIQIEKTWIQSTDSPTPATPAPSMTSTPTVTVTPAPGTATNTAVPTDTAIPIPGAMSTAIATSTECPGGCAVTALTAIPGLATITTVDTSPFSQLQHLSLARNGCTAFGYVQIPYPVIHGTPILGSTNPLSVTWTLPVTHDWDNTNPYSNTAIEPCAMNEIPTFVWDFTYWLSVFACSVVFIMWLIGLVGRLSGDETING